LSVPVVISRSSELALLPPELALLPPELALFPPELALLPPELALLPPLLPELLPPDELVLPPDELVLPPVDPPLEVEEVPPLLPELAPVAPAPEQPLLVSARHSSTLVMVLFTDPPVSVTAVAIPTPIRAAIRPYSTAVAPELSP